MFTVLSTIVSEPYTYIRNFYIQGSYDAGLQVLSTCRIGYTLYTTIQS